MAMQKKLCAENVCSCHVGRAQTISAFLLYSGVTRGFSKRVAGARRDHSYAFSLAKREVT